MMLSPVLPSITLPRMYVACAEAASVNKRAKTMDKKDFMKMGFVRGV